MRARTVAVAWVLRMRRPGGGWVRRLDDPRDTEHTIAVVEAQERREGSRLDVDLVGADGARFATVTRAVEDGRWVDATEARAS